MKSYGWNDFYLPLLRARSSRPAVRQAAKDRRVERLQILEDLLPATLQVLADRTGIPKSTVGQYQYYGYFVSHVVPSGRQNGSIRVVTAIDWDMVEEDPKRYKDE